MHIAIITAGGAGMFCGSCMQDNSLAKALMQLGCEVSLIPTYTPIRVDQQDVSGDKVFLGGVNLYLDHAIPFWSRLPRPFVSWLDHPRVLRFATSFGIENDASQLGALTIAMLQGSSGSMVREYQQLVDHLTGLHKPDIIIFSNALLSGVLPLLRKQFDAPIFCLLQGDDLFLDQLPGKQRQPAITALAENAKLFDLFLTHSQFYTNHMSEYLGIKKEKFRQIPLSIDLQNIDLRHDVIAEEIAMTSTTKKHSKIPRIGYFARISPEKGLLQLVRAIKKVHEDGIDVELHVGGYLGKAHHNYFSTVQKESAFLDERFQYFGSPKTEKEKQNFLSSLDIFSVPATYREPKGLYLLEAMSLGIPVVQPAHGSYPELIQSTEGGLLFEPGNIEDHARLLKELIASPAKRFATGQQARKNIIEKQTSKHAATALLKICKASRKD